MYIDELDLLEFQRQKKENQKQQLKAKLQTTKRKFEQKKIKQSIQALEGGISILSTQITNYQSKIKPVVDKNNYTSYESQVETAYKMYDAETNYGNEILPAIIDTRVSCICGEQININSGNPETIKFIDQFFKKNKLNGSFLRALILSGELQGKNLLSLYPVRVQDGDRLNNQKSYVKIKELNWILYKYKIETDQHDSKTINKITYPVKNNGNEEVAEINLKNSVYFPLAGSGRDINKTVNRIHRVLTQCENVSRASYDLRKNSHLFGHIKPVYEFDSTDQNSEAGVKAIQDRHNSTDFKIGEGYAGTARFKFVSPSNDGCEILIKNILNDLRFISTNTSIPLHWLAYPEMINARATAENIAQSIFYATQQDRMIWEEGLKELIEKAMVMAVEEGMETAKIIDDFSVQLPLIDTEKVLNMIDKLMALVEGKLLSPNYVLNMLPKFDPIQNQQDLAEITEKENETNLNNMGNEKKIKALLSGNYKDQENTENTEDTLDNA